jgi:hypothetical protein
VGTKDIAPDHYDTFAEEKGIGYWYAARFEVLKYRNTGNIELLACTCFKE